jgi:hypothetical protein
MLASVEASDLKPAACFGGRRETKMADDRVRGTALRGDEPKRLELSDGSRLLLDGSAHHDRVEWRRIGARDASIPHDSVSVREARHLAGEEYTGYVETRTRAEAAWLRAMADWYLEQADRLQYELAESGAAA